MFNVFKDDLISDCIDKNIGASINNLNVSIIVYSDDILLVGCLDKHLQTPLNIWSKFGSDRHIKFKLLKYQIISFDNLTFEKCINSKMNLP